MGKFAGVGGRDSDAYSNHSNNNGGHNNYYRDSMSNNDFDSAPDSVKQHDGNMLFRSLTSGPAPAAADFSSSVIAGDRDREREREREAGGSMPDSDVRGPDSDMRGLWPLKTNSTPHIGIGVGIDADGAGPDSRDERGGLNGSAYPMGTYTGGPPGSADAYIPSVNNNNNNNDIKKHPDNAATTAAAVAAPATPSPVSGVFSIAGKGVVLHSFGQAAPAPSTAATPASNSTLRRNHDQKSAFHHSQGHDAPAVDHNGKSTEFPVTPPNKKTARPRFAHRNESPVSQSHIRSNSNSNNSSYKESPVSRYNNHNNKSTGSPSTSARASPRSGPGNRSPQQRNGNHGIINGDNGQQHESGRHPHSAQHDNGDKRAAGGGGGAHGRYHSDKFDDSDFYLSDDEKRSAAVAVASQSFYLMPAMATRLMEKLDRDDGHKDDNYRSRFISRRDIDAADGHSHHSYHPSGRHSRDPSPPDSGRRRHGGEQSGREQSDREQH